MRSEGAFLSAIELELRKNIELNEHYFQVERMGGGDSYKTFYMQYSIGDIQEVYSFSTEIPQDVLYNTSGFKVVPKLPQREVEYVEYVEYVDLGLSVKWASCNLGASKLTDYGGYYQWAGTKDVFYPYYSNCPYHTGFDSNSGWTKYNTKSSYGTVDNKTVLESMDDAAAVALGGKGRMPTDEEWSELRNTDNCSWTCTTIDGVNGYKVQSKKPGYADNWIFLPAAGYRNNGNLYDVGSSGYYWSSSLNTGSPSRACYVSFSSGRFYRNIRSRYYGQSVRPVSE